jgi:epoxyqueuosine reductase
MSLEKEIIGLLKSLGAISVGFANLETLVGGPPSSDIRYIMPGAKSAISFALPVNKEFLKRFLAKETFFRTTRTISQLQFTPGRFRKR